MTSQEWQLANDAARRYEEILVPAILGPFAKSLADWTELEVHHTVVDVGCGTGAATRHLAPRLSESGRLIGTDVNKGMLEVAQSLPYHQDLSIDWRQETADNLSMENESVDVVVCAQVLQFLKQPVNALREIHRVLKNDGHLNISLWCEIEENPYFDALVNAIAEYISPETAAGLGSAFRLTNPHEINVLINEAGYRSSQNDVVELYLELPGIDEFVPRHISATPMGPGYASASPEVQAALLSKLSDRLHDYITEDGMTIPFRSHLIRAIK
ncbi:MAG: class I SAM-dependent methyltransferase [Anaerolineae bacterium]|nr:class I SAM-dependent methyltransferase [Anaerolineae bacterium]